MKGKMFQALVVATHMGILTADQLALASDTQKTFGETEGLRYQATGTRDGKVQIVDRDNGKTLRVFTMAHPRVIREIHVLEKGRVIGASQGDETEFWDMATTKGLYRAPYRIYAFSPQQPNFFTYRQGSIFLVAYPSFKDICKLTSEPVMGPDAFTFSPDGRFLTIVFDSGRPSSDDNYPNPNPQSKSYRYARLFDVLECKEINEFTALDTTTLGTFAPGGDYLELRDAVVRLADRYAKGTWRFDLSSHKLQQ